MSVKKKRSFPDVPDIAREILDYLGNHPDARDGIEGIMQWWLLERHVTFQTRLIREALAGLVREGLVVEVKTLSGRCYKLVEH
jgi:hypothetical protein